MKTITPARLLPVGKRRGWVAGLAIMLLLMVAVLVGQELVLSAAARVGLEWFFKKNGMELRADTVRFGIVGPFVVEGLSVRERHNSAFGSAIFAGRFEVVRHGWWEIIFDGKPFCAGLEIQRPSVFVDLRGSGASRARDSKMAVGRGFAPVFGVIFSNWLGMPARIACTDASVDVLSDSSRIVLEGVSLTLDEGRRGVFACEYPAVTLGSYFKRLPPMKASTGWGGGRLALASLELLPGVVFSEAGFDLRKLPEVSVTFRGSVCGGAVRGDIDLREVASGRIWDIAVLGSGIGLAEVAAELGLPKEGAAGRLSEARFTFRGAVGRPTDAEASLRVLAKDFKWNNRECGNLDIGASLIQRRLVVSHFDFEQPGNKITTNGELSLAQGWANIAEAPFLINLRARIEDPAALAGICGAEITGVGGLVEAHGSVSGRPGTLDGFFGLHATGVSYKNANADRLDLELLFRKKQIEVLSCEFKSGSDLLRCGGVADLAFPHGYSAWLSGNIADVAAYSEVIADYGGCPVSSGSLGIEWKGEGDVERPSGGFELRLGEFVSRWTPAGVTGHFKAGYTPGEMHFDTIRLEGGNLRLEAKGVFSSGGFELEDVGLTAGKKLLLEGRLRVPVDLAALRRGDSWAKVLHNDRPLALSIRTPGKLDLRELVRLVGQAYPLSGALSMDMTCEGLPGRLNGTAWLAVEDMRYGAVAGPRLDIDLRANMKEGALEGEGRMDGHAMERVSASLKVAPFLFQSDGEGKLLDPSAAISGGIVFPRTNLSLFAPLLVPKGVLSGDLSGELTFSNTLGEPNIGGTVEFQNVAFSHDLPVPDVEGLGGRVSISNGEMLFTDVLGRFGGGGFQMSGACRFPAPWEPVYDLTWHVDSMPLDLGDGITIPVFGTLFARGGGSVGSVSGNLKLGPAVVERTLRVDPLLAELRSPPPSWSNQLRTLSLFSLSNNWSLDVAVEAQSPILLGQPPLAARIVPALHLSGTVEDPRPTGRIDLFEMRIDTPGGPLFASQGSLHFLPDNPGEPFVMLEAAGVVSGMPVRAFAWGALGDGKWALLSGGDSHEVFWALSRGMSRLPSGEGLAPVDVSLYPNPDMVAQPISLRVVDNSVWCGGIALSRSLDFSIGPDALPEVGYRSGYKWTLAP